MAAALVRACADSDAGSAAAVSGSSGVVSAESGAGPSAPPPSGALSALSQQLSELGLGAAAAPRVHVRARGSGARDQGARGSGARDQGARGASADGDSSGDDCGPASGWGSSLSGSTAADDTAARRASLSLTSSLSSEVPPTAAARACVRAPSLPLLDPLSPVLESLPPLSTPRPDLTALTAQPGGENDDEHAGQATLRYAAGSVRRAAAAEPSSASRLLVPSPPRGGATCAPQPSTSAAALPPAASPAAAASSAMAISGSARGSAAWVAAAGAVPAAAAAAEGLDGALRHLAPLASLTALHLEGGSSCELLASISTDSLGTMKLGSHASSCPCQWRGWWGPCTNQHPSTPPTTALTNPPTASQPPAACSHLTDAGVASLACLPGLTLLDLGGCGRLEGAALGLLARAGKERQMSGRAWRGRSGRRVSAGRRRRRWWGAMEGGGVC